MNLPCGSKVFCGYRFPNDLWMIYVDSGQTSQVIQNLVLNALHAMPLGGSITITCDNIETGTSEFPVSRSGAKFFVRITVQDTGSGIAQEIINNIFDPYFSTKEDGSGLGLAICYAIVVKHDGSIIFSCKSMGKSFTF